MAFGPGVYDDLCTEIKEKTNADGVLLLIIKGDKGTGFSCLSNLEILLAAPTMLRDIANNMEKDVNNLINSKENPNGIK